MSFGRQDKSKALYFFHTNADYLVGFRLSMLVAFSDGGYAVKAFAPNLTEEHAKQLSQFGIDAGSYRLDATGFNPIKDMRNVWLMARMLRKESPDVVLLNNAKPVIFGGMAAALAGVRRRCALVGGLGYSFIEHRSSGQGLSRKLTKWLVSTLYAISFRTTDVIIFHNRDDLNFLVGRGICPKNKAAVVPGSGVDLAMFTESLDRPRSVFVFVGRLLRDKGIEEFLDAARMLKKKHAGIRFLVVGGLDANPASLREGDIKDAVGEGIVEWAGHVKDVRPYLLAASVFVLPSYREGLPRSALEAMACGLPVITTDVPGCREVVRNGCNGILVPVRDSSALAAAIEQLYEYPDLAESMGRESRRLAEEEFSVERVNRMMMDLVDGNEAHVER